VNSKEFRKELQKIMPGIKWTIHRPDDSSGEILTATATKTAGFNRLFTLKIIRSENSHNKYEAKSAGYGRKAQWLSSFSAPTLAQALRGLQNIHTWLAQEHRSHAEYIEAARKSNQ